jgi:hypothetical protein
MASVDDVGGHVRSDGDAGMARADLAQEPGAQAPAEQAAEQRDDEANDAQGDDDGNGSARLRRLRTWRKGDHLLAPG